MAATETRLLLLGSVLSFEPVNAYQLRRELLTWRVDQWAHVKPGSIYSGLATLTKDGCLDRHDLQEGGRTVAVYTSSPAGREEFDRLFAEAVLTLDQSSNLGLLTALTCMPMVARERFAELLRTRITRLEQLAADAQALTDLDESLLPPNVPFINRLWTGLVGPELAWAADTLARVERGEGAFAGEPFEYTRAPGDPGNEIERDRQRYRTALGLGGDATDLRVARLSGSLVM